MSSSLGDDERTLSPRQQLLRRWSRLLRLEAESQRVQSRQRPGLPLADGLASSRTPTGAVYLFETLTDGLVPEGARAMLRVDTAEYEAEVLHRADEEITLFVEPVDGELPPLRVPSATLLSEPWYLTDELASRLFEAGSQPLSRVLERLLERFEGVPARRDRPYSVPDGIDLNPAQEAAVAAALVEPLWWIWGPPGTGKTRSLGALAGEAAIRGEHVLVTAHSNVAVDTAMLAAALELEDRGHRGLLVDGTVVRAGPAIVPEAIKRALSARELVLKMNLALAGDLARLSRGLRQPGLRKGEVTTLRAELTEVRKEIRRLERALVGAARVVFCTLPKATIDDSIGGRQFTCVIVDEASMALPAQVVFAASLASARLTVLGDFRQLPPIVTSPNEDVQRAFARDVFAHAGIPTAIDKGVMPADVSMLTTQHRMHPAIRQVVSDLSYLGRLDDGRRVLGATEPDTGAAPWPGAPIVLVNTRLLGGRGWRTRDRSRINPMSAVWAVQLAREALLTVDRVALLAPYRGQVHLMTALVRDLKLRDRVTVGTIHRMQGAEAPAVVFDIVDAPPLGVPGRLLRGALGRRLVNVALSRAKSKLVVLGDIRALKPHPDSEIGAVLDDLRSRFGWNPETEAQPAGSTITFASIAETLQPSYKRDVAGIPTVAWVGATAPKWITDDLVALRLGADPPQPDQAIVLSGAVAWILGERRDRSWTAFRIEGERFADAVFDVLHGGGRRPLAPCTIHKDPTVVTVCGSSILVTCPRHNCATSRRAGRADLDLWAIFTDQRCGRCGTLLTSAQGTSWFYRCPRVGCAFTTPIS